MSDPAPGESGQTSCASDGIGEVVRVTKTNASVPLTEEEAEPLIKRGTTVVTAVGD